jgi:coenzyme F420-0:L-glutamate ligase/coenzyme F420-1:gamma-L-glutamate ligase
LWPRASERLEERSGRERRAVGIERIEVIPLQVSAPVDPEDRGGVIDWLLGLLQRHGEALVDGDVVVVTSKVASLLEGHVVRLQEIVPSRRARRLGRWLRRDPRKLELVLREGPVRLVMPMHRISRIPTVSRLVDRLSPRPEAMRHGYATANRLTLVTWKHGAFLDEAGIDYSNVREGYVALLPPDPSALARAIRARLRKATGRTVSVLITDTTTNIERYGSRDIALGFAGFSPAAKRLFDVDLYGVHRSGGADLTADSIAALGGVVMGQKVEMTPAMIVRGLTLPPEDALGVERLDEIAITPRARLASTWFAAWATLWFRLASALTFSRPPRQR